MAFGTRDCPTKAANGIQCLEKYGNCRRRKVHYGNSVAMSAPPVRSGKLLTLNTATAPTRDRDSGARHAAGLSPVTASKRGPAITFLELEESQAGPRSRVTRVEESELPDREDRFDWLGLDRPQRVTDARQHGREPLVAEALQSASLSHRVTMRQPPTIAKRRCSIKRQPRTTAAANGSNCIAFSCLRLHGIDVLTCQNDPY